MQNEELSQIKTVTLKGVEITFVEYYHLASEINEFTGVATNNLVPHYTKAQANKNIKAMQAEYNKNKRN
jgi:hypothetical protein